MNGARISQNKLKRSQFWKRAMPITAQKCIFNCRVSPFHELFFFQNWLNKQVAFDVQFFILFLVEIQSKCSLYEWKRIKTAFNSAAHLNSFHIMFDINAYVYPVSISKVVNKMASHVQNSQQYVCGNCTAVKTASSTPRHLEFHQIYNEAIFICMPFRVHWTRTARNFRSMKQTVENNKVRIYWGWMSHVGLCIVCVCLCAAQQMVYWAWTWTTHPFIMNSKQNIGLNVRANALCQPKGVWNVQMRNIYTHTASGMCDFWHLCDMEMFIPLENECQNESYHFGSYIHINRQSGLQRYAHAHARQLSLIIKMGNWKTHRKREGKRPIEMRPKEFQLILNEAFIPSNNLVAYTILNIYKIYHR